MQSNSPTQILTVRRIVVTGILGGVIILQSLVQILGYPPIPIPPGNATTIQITVIIGAVLEGPVVGLILGFIFGMSSFLLDTSGLFKNPFIAILPRLFIGPIAYYAYFLLRRWSEPLALAGGGVAGALTNSILVVAALITFGLLTTAVIPVLAPVVVVEAVLSAVLTVAVVAAVRKIETGGGGSSV
jgi:uncharacterized membrane protein